jgi:hypothetical protein
VLHQLVYTSCVDTGIDENIIAAKEKMWHVEETMEQGCPISSFDNSIDEINR